jgi:hypothetical protein
MVRRFIVAFVVMAFSVGILSAAEMIGVITKVDGSKITFKEGKKGDSGFEFGAAKTYTVAKDAKILKGGFKKDAEPTKLEGGLSNDMFKNLPEKGLFARVVTNDKNEVTEIRTFGFGKGKKKKDGGQ